MFELTRSALLKDLQFEQERHPAAFLAASLHENVLHDVLDLAPSEMTFEGVSQKDLTTPLSEKKIHRLEKVHSRDLLKCYLRRLGVSIDSQLLFDVTIDCDFEIWSPTMQFIGCSHGFMRASSYSFQDLSERNWSELFAREPQIQGQIVTAISWLMQDPRNRRYVTGVTDWHFVKETSARGHAIEIRVKSGGIAFDPNGQPQAIVAVTQLRSPSRA